MESTVRIVFKAKNNLLLKKREGMGFNQAQMAHYCGVTLNAYGRAERLDYEGAGKDNLLKIADTVEMDTDKLFPAWSAMFGEAFNRSKPHLNLDDAAAQNLLPEWFYNGGIPDKLVEEGLGFELADKMKLLPSKKRKILSMYYGLSGSKELTTDEIACKLGLTRTRVSILRTQGIANLRSLAFTRKDKLREYLG